MYGDDTYSGAALGGGVRGFQHANGVSAGAGCAVALAEERAARSPAPRSAGGYLRSRSCTAAGGGAGTPGRDGVRRTAASSSCAYRWGAADDGASGSKLAGAARPGAGRDLPPCASTGAEGGTGGGGG